ncbi:Vibriobactin utilization protein ViuB [Andreprevotia sp. IGB-42]|uniref:siderophore-interacting protein n=1 Tax=Andreprevotia sp. IGB-42 TaxID=2497473 RepID=UPI00135AC5CE|nr:siderophore-interacting protein [Andreprevotia sp. IGB-42]KAF0813082.1 Vibriobactin utilization protein ViuB [Andreprevotia sp. IGB-42]
MTSSTELAPQRVRHPLKFRLLQVSRVQPLSPHLVRITLSGDDLADFVSASFDDHIKVFFPAAGEDKPNLPTMGEDGPVYPQGAARPVARDYTPRRFDAAANELDIDFVLHGIGPATTWAAQAQVGQYLGIGGPRGSFVIPAGYDWHLLIGDDSALPAIARRLEQLPADSRALVIVEVADAGAQIRLDTSADASVQWLHRSDAGGAAQVVDAVRKLVLPAGTGYAWAAGELATAQAVRKVLVDELGIAKNQIRAASYWKQGAVASHETLDD